MQVLMLQHGDLCEHLVVVAAIVPREAFTADEKLRDPHACNVAEHVWRFVFHPSWRESVSVILLSQPISQCRSSLQNHHVPTQNCARTGLQLARWAHNLYEKLVQQNRQMRFFNGSALTGYCNRRHWPARLCPCRELSLCGA